MVQLSRLCSKAMYTHFSTCFSLTISILPYKSRQCIIFHTYICNERWGKVVRTIESLFSVPLSGVHESWENYRQLGLCHTLEGRITCACVTCYLSELTPPVGICEHVSVRDMCAIICLHVQLTHYSVDRITMNEYISILYTLCIAQYCILFWIFAFCLRSLQPNSSSFTY